MGVGRPVYGPDGQPLPLLAWPLASSFTKPDGSLGLYYGGTIADGAMVRALQHLKSRGYKVLFYPFLLMDVPPPDPAPIPCRGRITSAAADVAGFFTRPDGYLRFLRHCISLCEQAGGVDAFAVGSEMVGLNRIRDAGGDYPAVPFWRQIAAEATARLGSGCRVTYAADWSEYRYHDRGDGNVDFPLDPLWADPNVDFVGIDAYFPVTDEARATTDKDIIKAGWVGGELVDYFYANPADRDLVRRGYDPQRTPHRRPFRCAEGHSALAGDEPRPPRERRPDRAGDGLGAALEADLVHRVRVPHGELRDEPAERVHRSQERRELRALLLQLRC
jgi:hypothetical protein